MIGFLESPPESEKDLSVEPDSREFFRLSLSETHTFSKDTLDIDARKESPLKSCILIAKAGDPEQKISVKKAKSVQFADTLGKPLKSVKLLAGSPDDLFALNFLNFRSSTARRSFPARERNIFQDPGIKPKEEENKYQGVFENFKNGFEFLDLEIRVGKHMVSIEKVSLQNDNSVFGTIVVKNICFEKHVEVRYTWDNWVTHNNHLCKYITLSKVPNADVFSFHIPFKKQEGLTPETTVMEKRLAFAVCYTANGVSHWDSNDGENYVVLFKSKGEENVKLSKKLAYL